MVMIDKFVNDEMSENDVKSMMHEFFDKKDEVEFKRKWHGIVDEQLDTDSTNVISFFKRNFSSTALVASMILVLIGSTFLITDSVLFQSFRYTVLAKGNKENIKKLNSNIKDYHAFVENKSTIDKEEILQLYNSGRYKKVMNEVEDMIDNNGVIDNKRLIMAGFSSIKRYHFKKAKYFMTRIDSTSPFYDKSQEMLEKIIKIID